MEVVNLTWHRIHPNFKFNGVHYKFDELQEIGYDLVKEGEPYEIPIGEFLLDWSSDKPTLEVFTSGSTGKPKKITLKKEHMVNSARATGAYFELVPGHRALLCLPCFGIAGKMMLVRAMVLGLELQSVEPSSTPIPDATTYFHFAAMVPLQVENSLKQLHQIKTLIIGGAPISKSLIEALKAAPNAVYETYGMTETVTHVAVRQIPSSNNPTIQQSNFIALPEMTFSQDARGCLVINAPKVSDAEVITNDVVHLISENSFEWLGRYDSIVNSGGVKLFPEQIEKKLSTVIHARFFVAGIPDEKLGQKLVLLVESTEISIKELLEKIRTLKNLGKYEVPKEIFNLKAFVETETGKIQREKTLFQIR